MLSLWLNAFGLLLSVIGSGLLYLGTPVDTGGIHNFAYGDPEADKKKLKIKRRRLFTKIGFVFLLIGFLLQFFSTLSRI